jgi:serine/threonine-protein kinase
VDSTGSGTETTRVATPDLQPIMECPTCGRCEEPGTAFCPADGSLMHVVHGVAPVIDRKYRVEQLLGRGGMGAVYRARDVRLDRLVALKVVRAELLGDAEARQRFRREAQIVAGLQHPSIVSVFDYGTLPDGGAYLVMELVRGEDLRRVLQREGRIERERALQILSAVCQAIEAAHREGVLHRDLKPENILLPGKGVAAKVLDFGVAKVVREDPGDQDTIAADPSLITAAGMIIGTPAYMAPEQLRGLVPDARSDIFSLGAVAFEMLTGQLPFGRGSLADIVLAQARGVPRFPPDVRVPPDLEDAVRAALDPDPDRRPPTARAFESLITDH